MLALTIGSTVKWFFSNSDIPRLTMAGHVRKEVVRVSIQVERFAQRLESPDGALQVYARKSTPNTHRVGSCIDLSSSTPLTTAKELCEYWQTKNDWRRCEPLLHSYPQSITTIDGVEVYFLQIRSKHENRPLLMVLAHG
jgi:hypothetical protein